MTCEILNDLFASRWDHPALICDERSLKYSELYEYATAIQIWLSAKGCHAGNTVALLLPNGWPFAVAYLACIIGNYRFVPINPEYSFNDKEYILQRVSAKIVLEDEKVLSNLKPEKVSAPKFSFPAKVVSAVFFTSGTTGRPKGVCHTLDALIGNVLAFNQFMGLKSDIRLYHCLPMAYMAGFLNTLLSPWLAGGTVLLGPRFSPAEALQFWKRPLAWQANAIWFTPTLAAVLVRMNRDSNIASKVCKKLQHIFCGTAPLPISVRQAFLTTFGCPLQESYGMSEVLLVSAQTRSEANSRIDVGHLLPGVQITFHTRPQGVDPEIVVHTPFALIAYMLDDVETSPLFKDGGMPSGDTGKMDGGALIISGRLKDLIIRGGLNISPMAVESILMRDPGVQEVAVVGLPHDFWGECIVACVVPEKDTDVRMLQTSLQLLCTMELGEGMRPDRYVWLDALPRASSGKVQKHIIIEQLT